MMVAENLICVVGPSCSGKGSAALNLADRLGGPANVELISCDSAKIYKGMDIGTAKRTIEARRGYSVYMMDVEEPANAYSAGRYGEDAAEVIEAIWGRDNLPIVVGGTGLYLRALLDGICNAPTADEDMRQKLQQRVDDGENLLAELTEVDPQLAKGLYPNNIKRIIRGLEVFYISGKPLSEWHKSTVAPLSPKTLVILGIDAPRIWIWERIERRAKIMIERGLEDEVRGLLDAGVPCTAPSMRAIGYSQTIKYIDGEINAEEWLNLIARDTRRLGKRQRTWFRGDERVKWFDATADDLTEQMVDYIKTETPLYSLVVS